MRKCWGVLLFAAAGMLDVSTIGVAQDKPLVIQDGSPVVMEQKPVPRTASGKVDLSGLWGTPSTDEGRMLAKRYGPQKSQPLSMTPWAKERFDYNTDARTVPGYAGAGHPQDDPAKFLTSEGGGIFGGRTELNPIFRCLPPSAAFLVAGWQSAATHEIIQNDKRVMMIYEMDHTVRQVWTDGRKHPDQVDPTWMGHAIGHWEGDTFVVDTIGLRNGVRDAWLDGSGHVAGPNLHIVERYQRLDNDTMRIELTLEDPKAFTKPWIRTIYRRLRPKWDLIQSEVRCYPGAPELQTWEENYQQIFIEP